MPKIQCLSPHLADLIAAGEVVERPASVVKELCENALDAGASAIVIETEGGGVAMLRVSDDGCGIAPEELPTAFLRHATSKLQTEQQLAAIGTLGFRGEALASIAAVSRVEILSRVRGSSSGASLHLNGGKPEEVLSAAAGEGTVITVRELFYNTPARLKFMKKDTAENAAIHTLVRQLALSHPEISFRLFRDGEEVLHSPGDGKLLSAVYAALGRDFALSLAEVRGANGDIRCAGFVTKPLASRGSRGMQNFFVNGRLVKSQLLTAALEEGYRNRIMKGKFPGCVLHISLPVDEADVNVHPAKTQVKFLNEKAVFDAVYYTVLDALNEKPVAEPPKKPEPPVNPRGDFYQTMSSDAFRRAHSAVSPRPVEKPAFRTSVPPVKTEFSPKISAHDSVTPFYRAEPVATKVERKGESKPVFTVRPVTVEPPKETPKAAPVQETLTNAEVPWRIAGELLKTYIICEDEAGTVHLIDKHAAHERILFDKLKNEGYTPMTQTLLAPIAAEVGEEAAAALLAKQDLLTEYGFQIEDFGPGALLLRTLPADIDEAEATGSLEMLYEEFRSHRNTDPAALRDDLLHTIACKAAVKAGMTSSREELAALGKRVQSGEIRYCPHGRPVCAELTKYQLEKMFKRA